MRRTSLTAAGGLCFPRMPNMKRAFTHVPRLAAMKLPSLALLGAILWVLFVTVAHSDAGWSVGVFLLCYGVSVVWGSAWLIRLVVYALKSRWGVVTKRRRLAYWAIEPLALILAVVISNSEVPFYLRFMASRPSLERYVKSMKDPERDSRIWVGLYLLRDRTEMLPDGVVRFITCHSGFGDHAGFAFAPNSSPPVIGEDSYTKLPFAEGWYHWHLSW